MSHTCFGVECSCQSPPSSASSDDYLPPTLIQNYVGEHINRLEDTQDGGAALMYADQALLAITCYSTWLPTKELCVEVFSSMEFALAALTYFNLKEKYIATPVTELLSLDETDELGNVSYLGEMLALSLRSLHTSLFSSVDLAEMVYDVRMAGEVGSLHHEAYEAITGNEYLSQTYKSKLRVSILMKLFQQASDEE
jgi:hypothetical protein